eukprot:773408-Prorocentrum_minimum.AAC.1
MYFARVIFASSRRVCSPVSSSFEFGQVCTVCIGALGEDPPTPSSTLNPSGDERTDEEWAQGRKDENAPPGPDEEDRLVRLACGHGFHFACACGWFRCSSHCPNCRAPIASAQPASPPPETPPRPSSQ